MVPLARRYLLFDRPRLAISAGGVAFAVVLIVLNVALYRGIYEQAGELAHAPPSQLWVTQSGAADPFASSILPAEVLDEVREVPGVGVAQPLLVRSMQVGSKANSGMESLVMALPEGPLLQETAGSFGVSQLPEKGQIVLSDVIARELGAGRGDIVYIGAQPFEVVAASPLVDAPFGHGTAFVSAEDGPALFRVPDVFSFLLVVVGGGADVRDVESAIEQRIPGANALTPSEFAATTRREIEEGFLPVLLVLIGIAFVVGLAVVALTIYTSTVERSRDYGILKAVGAKPGQLFGMVLRQSVAVGLLGYGFGVLLSLGGGRLISQAVPEFTTLFRWQDVLAVLVVALLMSAITALVPVRRVARVDPAAVFRA